MTDIHQPAMASVTPDGQSRPELVAAATLTAAQLALYAGWTMAVLYVPVPPEKRSSARPDHRPGEAAPVTEPLGLPTVHELPEPKHTEVELGRLYRLLGRLAELPDCSDLTTKAPVIKAGEPDFQARLRDLHGSILEVLASAALELELAYELGRSLRDTVNPPMEAEDSGSPAHALTRQLARARIAKLQEWLATLSAEFPSQAAAIVAASMGRWSDFTQVTMGTSAARRRKMAGPEKFAGQMGDYLLQQGDVWLMLLIGVRSTAGLLTPEGYVAAGETALSRSARIVRGVLAHYWGVLPFLAAALGGILYLAATQLGGAAQVWTSIAAIGGTLGISAQSIRSAIARLSTEAERPVFAAAEEDAKAWAITTMPHADLTPRGVRHLRKSGIAKTVGLGRY
jgi:hypothetical protein